MSLNLLLQGPQFAFKEALRSACGLAAGVAYSLMHCMLALIWGQLETRVWQGSFPNSTTPSSLYCLLSPLRLSLSIQNGIVKSIYDGSLDSHIFPAFLFHTMFPGCVRKVGLFPARSEGCLHETLPSLLFPCPFTLIPERAVFLSCLLHGKLCHVFDRK